MTDKLPSTAVAKAPLQTGSKIAALVPTDIEQAFRMSKVIAAAGFAPKAYGNDENKIMVGILHGMEVGMTPIAALQSIAVINGSPTIWGDGALALVRSSGLLVDFEETIAGDGDNAVATCRCVRKDQASPIVRSFSMKDAIAAGLKGKQGPWSQYPKRMLQMRARSWALRDGFADILRGLGIREEAQDMGTLVDQGDGSYAQTPPPRPTRAEYAEPERQVEDEPAAPEHEYKFEAWNHWGERSLQTDDAAEFGKHMIDLFDAAGDRRTVDTLIENNRAQPTDLDPEQVSAIMAATQAALNRTDTKPQKKAAI